MARPRKVIDPQQVHDLAMINCSYAEMAAVLKCNVSTLTRRFAQVIKDGRDEGKMSLKRKQWQMAMGGSVTMAIWLGKNLLGQSDKLESRSDVYHSGEIKTKQVSSFTDSELQTLTQILSKANPDESQRDQSTDPTN